MVCQHFDEIGLLELIKVLAKPVAPQLPVLHRNSIPRSLFSCFRYLSLAEAGLVDNFRPTSTFHRLPPRIVFAMRSTTLCVCCWLKCEYRFTIDSDRWPKTSAISERLAPFMAR